jgi:hypothetical protein
MARWITRFLVLAAWSASATAVFTAPFPAGFRATLWGGFGLLLLVTSFMDGLTETIFVFLPVAAGVVWVGLVAYDGRLSSPLLWIGVGINSAFLGLLLPCLLRWWHASLALGDWLVFFVGAGYLALSPGYFVLWMGGSLMLIRGFRALLNRMQWSINRFPFLPFSWGGYLLTGLLWSYLPVALTRPY